MKNRIFFILIVFALIGCTPSEGQIQNALDKTQASQPTSLPTPNPTPTQDYCPEQETKEMLEKFYELHDIFAVHFNLAQDDYKYESDAAVEITKLKRELDELEVPLCLEYAKELLSTAFQNSIDGFKKSMAGSLTGQLEYFAELEVNIELFYDEHDRISDCLPNCEMP